MRRTPHPPTAIIDADDCVEAYEDAVTIDFSDFDETEPCAQSPTGQCQYSARDRHRRCVHCGTRRDE